MNDVLGPILDLIRREPGAALLAAAGAYLALFALMLWTLTRYSVLARRQARLLRGADGASLERMLLNQIEGADAVRDDIADAADRGTANAAQIRLCLQRVGLVRYDAFPDVGGQQSFSLAFLDADNNGMVLSGLFSRHHMRVYAKSVERGASPQTLTGEELEAIAASRPGPTRPRQTR